MSVLAILVICDRFHPLTAHALRTLSVGFCRTLGGKGLGPCIYPCILSSSTVSTFQPRSFPRNYNGNGGHGGIPGVAKQRHGQIYFHTHGRRIEVNLHWQCLFGW
ncbi:hypothetical protein BDW60DRAFT_808 [Aspergillus nidulans var. acristatus]